MKRNSIYIGIALIMGVVVGYFIFGESQGTSPDAMLAEEHLHDEDENGQWTCSMHPQVLQPEPGSCPICAMDLIPVAKHKVDQAPNAVQLTENAMALADIQTTMVGTTMKDGKSLVLSGKIAVNKEKSAVQVSYFNGRIERLYVNYEGQDIRKGQLLAQLYAPELVAAQQELITAAALKTSQPSLYKAVRNKLKLWKLSEKQINAIEASGEIQENMPIYATVSGTVGTVMITEGDHVNRGQALLELNELNVVWATFDAYENQLSQLTLGTEIEIVSNAYPNTPSHAKISFIDPVLNTQTRTVMVRATINNSDGRLKPGMFVSGELKEIKKESHTKMHIPASAVLWTGKRSLVYVKKKTQSPAFEMREVLLGAKIGEEYRILSGLEEGEEIVTKGAFTVDAAAQLQGKKSMMNTSKPQKSMEHEGHKAMEGEMEHEGHSRMQQKPMGEVSPIGFQKLVKPYLGIKDALVKANTAKASASAKIALEQAEIVLGKHIDQKHQKHFDQILKGFRAIAENIAMQDQRHHFMTLSEHMIALAKSSPPVDSKIYVQYCPMADNNRGAFWLSAENEIRNPYFGDAMLKCGSISEIL
ncbi:efflux RND transporter periplasmic adaptor subunit [Spongiimicrobium salis]|uniref:efflux RND transporter periplasmic adaptor subunit n=1 Tax=Spongiimicrobium salis TaxID=1667022 RepID=UPI00374DF05E